MNHVARFPGARVPGRLEALVDSAAGSALQHGWATARAGEAIYRAGELSEDVLLLREGWATQVVQLDGGRRQILSIVLPGDFCSYRMVFSPTLDFSIRATTRARYSRFERAGLKLLLVTRPAAFDAFGSALLDEDRRLTDLVVNLGRRTAKERIAYVILSILERLDVDGSLPAGPIAFPIRQTDLADMAGITTVHTSRLLADYRKMGVFVIARGQLHLLDRRTLERIGRV